VTIALHLFHLQRSTMRRLHDIQTKSLRLLNCVNAKAMHAVHFGRQLAVVDLVVPAEQRQQQMVENCNGISLPWQFALHSHFSGSNVHSIATKRCFVSAVLTVAILFFAVNM
jgi:hypothetical protein